MTVLYNLIISPIELVLEITFELMFRILGNKEINQGLAVIGVSLAISLLTLPLYRRADAMQQKERDMQKKLARWTNHIRKTFKGDERFMMLRAYYRINGYTPLSTLNGSVSLLLEIPFFIAAYHFLSHLAVLHGASFGPIADLGLPDQLLHLGNLPINLLPILMTAINCVASAIYLKGFPVKDKVQTYGMAVIFLVLLYNSPSGLVVYWTCNNIFSLIKNIFYRLKNPQRTAYLLCAILGTLATAAVFTSGILNTSIKKVAMLVFQGLVLLPLLLYMARGRVKKQRASILETRGLDSVSLFLLVGVFLSILTGVLIPSSVIASSPAEFINLDNYRNPFLFLVNSTCYAAGFFLVWMGIIRHMLAPGAKAMLNLLLWILSGVFLLDYMCFNGNLGILSPILRYENDVVFSHGIVLINLMCIVALSGLLLVLFRIKRAPILICTVLVVCSALVSIWQIHAGQNSINDMAYLKTMQQTKKIEPVFSLSTKGKNVIVFMLDRAISGYVPYIMQEKPELEEQFDGFRYYPNTVSYGRSTNFGAPPLFGGYDYTLEAMNRRSSERLVDKHNEALKMLPVLFSRNNYKATVCDPPFANYKWIPDLSIFSDYPEIKTALLSGNIKDEALQFDMLKNASSKNERNFFCYSVFRVLPLAVSALFYDDGNYFTSDNASMKYLSFFKEFSVLTLLAELTKIDTGNTDTFLSIQNSSTHEPCILQLPDYVPKDVVDNSGCKTAADGHIAMESRAQISHYHVNMATFLQMGKWFDFMREKGVYDNTRIIIVADHGFDLNQFDYMQMPKFDLSLEGINPLLLVKDFNAKGFGTDRRFMTVADVPSMAVADVLAEPRNPFTGNLISNADKFAHPQVVTTSEMWNTSKNNGNVFDTSDGELLSVHDDIFNPDNWEKVTP